MKVPLIDLRAGFEPLKERFFDGVREALESMQLFLGPNVKALETEFAQYCSVSRAVATSSGTSALHLALIGAGVKGGDEVITTSFSFYATAEAICHAGATPVFVDVKEDTFNLNPDKIESAITDRTTAIVPVHFGGQMADMTRIMEIAKANNLKVIEDAAQAHGAAWDGKHAGSVGDTGSFSFYFTKNMGGYGEGGMVTTNDESMADTAALYRHHGHSDKFNHTVIGYNYRPDEIQAVALRLRLENLDEYNNKRRKVAESYTKALEGIPGLITPRAAEKAYHVYHLFPIRCERRDELRAFLTENEIGTGVHYQKPIHMQKVFADAGWKAEDLPVTLSLTENILSLPMYPELPEECIVFITDKVREFYSA